MAKFAALLCAAALSLTACGNEDDDTAKANISAELQKPSSLGPSASEEEADCLAGGMVDEVGAEQLQEYGFLTEDLKVNQEATKFNMDEGDAEAFAGVYLECIDVEQATLEQAAESKGAELTAKEQTCIQDEVDEETVEQGLVAFFQDEQDKEYAAMQTAAQACLPTPQG